ncbi:MAG: fused MFS/spermidine synthase [Bacteroidales bacterium]|nr:fused MFS/spermidine synthase [Bacteroidales bacterium]
MSKIEFVKFLKSFLAESVIESVVGDTSVRLDVVYVNGRKVLNAPHANYSYGHLHRIFQETFQQLNFSRKTFNQVLILGFGAGSVMSILQNDYQTESTVTGVEIDKVIISLAEKYFNLHNFRNLTIVNEDAYLYMERNRRTFDLIIIDLYIDNKVPEKFETLKFLEMIEKGIAKNGIVLFNKFVFDKKSGDEADDLLRKFEQTLGFTEVITIKSKRENRMLVYRNK